MLPRTEDYHQAKEEDIRKDITKSSVVSHRRTFFDRSVFDGMMGEHSARNAGGEKVHQVT
jgi:hypothetical protein